VTVIYKLRYKTKRTHLVTMFIKHTSVPIVHYVAERYLIFLRLYNIPSSRRRTHRDWGSVPIVLTTG